MTDMLLVNKQSVRTTIDRIRQLLDEIDRLFNVWTQLSSDKNRYENSEREADIKTQIRNNLQQYRQVAGDIQSGEELLKEPGGEFYNAVGVDFTQSNTLVVKEMFSKTFATRIENELDKIHGIKSVKIELETRNIQVEFDAYQTSLGIILNTMLDLGIEVELK